MNELIPTAPANVIIGVCGEQAAGKTIFLTCIFQSIWTACPDDVILDFDRQEIGNAHYFHDIEDRLIATGKNAGTAADTLVPARIYIKPYETLPGALPPVLSVDVQDFAGRHFRSLENLTGLGPAKASDPDDVKALHAVNDTIKKADAFVILINAQEIDPLKETPLRNPFSPSVNFLLTHCRTEKKPVALLFSQVDQARQLTDAKFSELPRVQAFRRQFTSDRQEFAAGKRPFGITQRIACYETVEGDAKPIRQTGDGNIWRPEPAKIVLELLRAAMPRINARLRAEQDAAREKQEREEREAQRRRRIRRIASMAAVLGLLFITGVSILAQYMQSERKTLRVLRDTEERIRDGRLASISPPMESALSKILAESRNDRNGTSSAVRSAIRDVHAAFAEAAQRLTDQPSLTPEYSAELIRFRALAPLIDPENTATWRQTLLPLLQARTAFLANWLSRDHNPRERTLLLDEAVQQFSADDEVFARILAAQSESEKQPSVAFSRSKPRRAAA